MLSRRTKQQKMFLSKPLCHNHKPIVTQVLAAMLRDRPFDAQASPSSPQLWSTEAVSEVLRSVPRFFFQSPRSIGCQKTFRHRAPLRQRSLRRDSRELRSRDLDRVELGLDKAMEFYFWVEGSFGFSHSEKTCREMALVLARGNRLSALWDFLRDMAGRESVVLVTTSTVTCLIKVLGEQGFVNEALALFYRMRKFRCKPDVFAYNTIIYALCRVGNFNRARFLLEQMELPGFRCPPDTFTYTILISSYCRHGLQTGCKKAIRRRLWEANHLFRIMLFKGFVPDVVTYNSLINGCCKTYRIERALELLEDMNERGCVPNRVTFNSFIRYYSAVNEIDEAVEMLRRMQDMNREMPSSSSYTPIIHAFCEAGKALEARDFLVELVDGGSVPREYTYKLVCDALLATGEADSLDESFRKRIEDGIEMRFKQVGKFKRIMIRRGYDNKNTCTLNLKS